MHNPASSVFRGVCSFKGKVEELKGPGGTPGYILTLVPGSSHRSTSRGTGGSSVSTRSSVVAFRLIDDSSCDDFVGHTGSVVALAVMPPPPPPHTVFTRR